MRKFKWALGMLLLALVPVLAWVSVARAQHFAAQVDENQVIHSSVYSVGKEVAVKGTIYGDVFCAGQKVTVDATVYGDVICAGMDVTVSGKVEGDVRAAGQLVTLSGAVGKSATIAAMNFSLDADAKVGQDLTATGEQLNIKGQVGRDVITNGSSTTINGPVARNVKATVSNLQLKDHARISGGLYYASGRAASIDQKAVVKGETKRTEAQKNENQGFNVMLYLFAIVGLTLVGLVLAFLFPRFMQRTSDEIVASAPKMLVAGLIGGLLAIALPIGLLISLAGIPLGLMVLLAGLVGVVLSGPITAYWVGRVVFRKKQNVNPVLIALVGSPILITLYFLPWIGWLILLLAYWFGFGALLLSLKPFVGNKIAVASASTLGKTGKKK